MSGDLLLANVAEAGDIVLYSLVLLLTVVIGLALFGMDILVGRVRRRRGPPTERVD